MAEAFSAPRDTELLLRRAPRGGASTARDRSFYGPFFENLCCIDICMFNMTTLDANKLSLRHPAISMRVSAGGAGLRRIRSRDLDKLAASPIKFVAKHFLERRPSSVQDTSVQCRLLTDVSARFGNRACGTRRHVRHAQLLDNYRTVAIGVGSRQLVQEVHALTPHLAVQARNYSFGFLAVLGSFLFSIDTSLRSSERLQRLVEEPRIRYDYSIGIGDDCDDSTVECDNRRSLRRRGREFDFADNVGKPLISVSGDGAGLRRPLYGSVLNDAHGAEFGEVQGTIETPYLGMRLTHCDRVAALTLPSWCPSNTLETALPRFVKFGKELCTDVSRYVCKPWKIGTELRQLEHLVERCWIPTLSLLASQPEVSLLKGEVPKETQRALPLREPQLLLLGRVDAIAKRFADEHKDKRSAHSSERNHVADRCACRPCLARRHSERT